MSLFVQRSPFMTDPSCNFPFRPNQRGWDCKQNWTADQRSFQGTRSNGHPAQSQTKQIPRKAKKRLRDYSLDQVDSALKKLRFSTEKQLSSSSSSSSSSQSSQSSSSFVSSNCTALVPVKPTRPKREEWDRSRWYARRSKPKFPDRFSFPSFDPDKPVQLPSQPSAETALVLYRPPGKPLVESDDESEETFSYSGSFGTSSSKSAFETNSKTLYSSPRCTVELIDDEEEQRDEEHDVPMF